MGCVLTKEQDQHKNSANDAEKIRNREIDTQIKQDKAQLKSQVKLLLLGAGKERIFRMRRIFINKDYTMTGESGKSTLIKQMKLIHEGGYSKEERDTFREIIYSNTIQSMRVILEAMEEMEIQLNEEMLPYRKTIYALPQQIEQDTLPPEATEAIKVLWKDAQVLQVYSRSQEYQLNDSAK